MTIAGLTLARLGTGALDIVLAWSGTRALGGVSGAGWVLSLYGWSRLLATLAGGVLADLYGSARMARWINLGRGLLTVPALATAATGGPAAALYGFSAVQGILGGLYSASPSTLLSQRLEKEALTRALGLYQSAMQIALLVGPALAGAAVGFAGLTGGLLTVGAFYSAAALILWLSSGSSDTRGSAARPAGALALLQQTRGGLAILCSDRYLLLLVAIALAVNVFSAPLDVLLPAYFREIVGVDDRGYGLAMAVWGAGMAAGGLSLLVRGRPAAQRPEGLWWVGVGLLGVLQASLGLSSAWIPSLLMMAAIGFVTSRVNARLAAVTLSSVRQESRGTVIGFTQTGSMALLPPAMAVTGQLAAGWGVVPPLVLGGAVILLAAVLAGSMLHKSLLRKGPIVPTSQP